MNQDRCAARLRKTSGFFEGFATHDVRCGNAVLHCRAGGQGQPLLLLHGFPQTHVQWHRLAPLLTDAFTLILPDLRGYGASRGPEPDPRHIHYSKREMARDMERLMSEMGHDRFGVVSHDRGARVGYRLALDCPGRVTRFVSLDTVPTLDSWEATDMDTSIRRFHWSFLAQPAPLPERMMGADPDFFIMHLLERWAGRPGVLDPAAIEAYKAAFRRPSVRQAMAEDYRAGATVDFELDRQDRRSGRKLRCPVLALRGALRRSGPLRSVWERWADDVSEAALDCGHFIAEEAPEACAEAVRRFLLAGQGAGNSGCDR